MNRFSRWSRISPLELCLEQERRAWHAAVGLFTLLLAGAAGALICPAPPGHSAGRGEAAFSGFLVHAAGDGQEGEPALPVAHELRSLPEPVEEVAVQLPLAVQVEPEAPGTVALLLHEASEPEPLFALSLPEELPPPRRSAPRQEKKEQAQRGQEPAGGRSEAPAGEFVAASYRIAPHPPYPPGLRARRAEGCVGLRIFLDAEGVPKRVEVSSPSGHAELDRCARQWVQAHWRFHPARCDGLAVASIVRTQLEFVLH